MRHKALELIRSCSEAACSGSGDEDSAACSEDEKKRILEDIDGHRMDSEGRKDRNKDQVKNGGVGAVFAESDGGGGGKAKSSNVCEYLINSAR